MNILIATFTLTAAHCLLSASDIHAEDKYRSRVNEYFDKMSNKLGLFMINQGLDPMTAPGIKRELRFKDLLGITWHGGLQMTGGRVTGLSLFSRSGNVLVNYDRKIIRIKAGIAFKKIVVQYNWKAHIMDIGRTGTATGTLKKAKVLIDMIADLGSMELCLQDMKIINAEKIDLKIDGRHSLLDLLINAITDLVNIVFHDLILDVLNQKVRPIVGQVVREMDLRKLIGIISGIY